MNVIRLHYISQEAQERPWHIALFFQYEYNELSPGQDVNMIFVLIFIS